MSLQELSKKFNYILADLNYFLEEVSLSDARAIFDLRNKGGNSNYLNKITFESHIEWLKRQALESLDYYFSVRNKSDGMVVGYIGLYDFKDQKAEWGRWVIDSNPIAALESLVLIHDFAFSLKLKTVVSKTLMNNSKVTSLHQKLPYSKLEDIQESGVEFLHCRLDDVDWLAFREYLVKKISKVRK